MNPTDLAGPGPEDRFSPLRRSLVLRDVLVFLSLAAISLVLFGMTLALFRSFEAHRDGLGRSWAARGQAALAHQDPQAAVPALRAALSYKPDERAYQLLLAEALAGSGHLDEATNYFLNLWTARPGDGFVNLQLARLNRTRDDGPQAVEYYRAAIFGDWGDQGPLRRRECRLELAQYLVERHDPGSARTELLLAAGNAPNDAPVNLLIGARLAAVDDLPSALASFKRALTAVPSSTTALVRTGAVSFLLGDFAGSEKLLNRALHTRPGASEPPSSSSGSSRTPTPSSAGLPADPDPADIATLARDAVDLADLSLSRELPSDVRGPHLLHAANLAEARLRSCTVASPAAPDAAPHVKPANRDLRRAETHPPALLLPPFLLPLAGQWKATGRDLRRRSADGNAIAQDSLADLIFATERATALPGASSACGPIAGDDALLLLLASTANGAASPPVPAVTAILSRANFLATGVRP